MIPTVSGPTTRVSSRRRSLLLASSLLRAMVALGGVAVIWLTTGWAMGWW